jgi:tetratricopeptide (TPR) repeat protein
LIALLLFAVVEAVSLLGQELQRPEYPADIVAQRESELADARAELERNPDSADALIWVGRRLGYLGRYRDSIDVFSEGVRRFPADARFLRHRGHRYITLRELGRAIADLDKAERMTRGKRDQVEPDGLPNARNIPLSSLQSNICYHLGLAWYLKGEFDRALPVYERCQKLSTNPDRLVSVSHWHYMTLRRLGRPREAERLLSRVDPSIEVIENTAYHKLLMMYRGEISVEDLTAEAKEGLDRATILYGIGNWHVYNGEPARGQEIFERMVEEEPWPAFGTLAAEAELARELK